MNSLDASPVDQDLVWTLGDSIDFTLTFTDASTGDPIDLSGFTYQASLRKRSWDSTEFAMPVDDTSAATGVLVVATPTDDTLPRRGVWDLVQVDGSSNEKTLIGGTVLIERRVTVIP